MRIFVQCLMIALLSIGSLYAQKGKDTRGVPAAKSIPEPYCSIKNLPFDDHGWFTNQVPLEKCLQQKPARIVVEVGAWLGASTRFIAQKIPVKGKVYAVDTWAGSVEHQNDSRLPKLYQLFLSNVKQAKLCHKIVPVRMQSLEAASALALTADLIYIDASHDEENVFNDIVAWMPHLSADGIMCGDDWGWESVRRGVERAAKQLNYKIESENNFWRLVR